MRVQFYLKSSAVLFFCAVLFFSCSFNEEERRRAILSGEEESVENFSSYFTENENGEYIFSVNDKSLLTGYGRTYWTLLEEDAGEGGEFENFEIEIQKTYGNSDGGFGIVFCQSEDEEWGYCLWAVLLDINGRWCAGKMTDGVFVIKENWTYSNSLYAGYALNRIKVSKEDGAFMLFFNGIYETSFCDTSEPFLGNGKRGFCAVVTEKEKFPDTPVTVIYTMCRGEE